MSNIVPYKLRPVPLPTPQPSPQPALNFDIYEITKRRTGRMFEERFYNVTIRLLPSQAQLRLLDKHYVSTFRTVFYSIDGGDVSLYYLMNEWSRSFPTEAEADIVIKNAKEGITDLWHFIRELAKEPTQEVIDEQPRVDPVIEAAERKKRREEFLK